MSGPDDVGVVWLEQAETREDAARALADWARARGLRLGTSERSEAARPPNAQNSIRIDPTIADRVEKELDRARETIAALDADGAERALARAEAILRDHPELPQAAWLRAEVDRSWSARWSRVDPRDDARAMAAWQDAEALDGGRAAGVGETSFVARAKMPALIAVRGGNRGVVVRLDGIEQSGGADHASAGSPVEIPLDVAPGEHQVVVAIDGETVLASWVALAPLPAGSPCPVLSFNIGDDGVCSSSALASAKRDGATVSAPNVSCDAWVAAIPAAQPGAVLVARCHGSTCGPLLEWRSGPLFAAATPEKAPPQKAAWPAWATWTAVGVGAVAAATVTLIATGIFETRPTEPRFTNGGVRIE